MPDFDDLLIAAGMLIVGLGVTVLLIVFTCKMTNSGPWSPKAYELEEQLNTKKIEEIKRILGVKAEAQ